MGFIEKEMGHHMSPQEIGTPWQVEVFCLNPARKRMLGIIYALSEEQAKMIAEKRAEDVLGKKGEVWTEVRAHIPKTT